MRAFMWTSRAMGNTRRQATQGRGRHTATVAWFVATTFAVSWAMPRSVDAALMSGSSSGYGIQVDLVETFSVDGFPDVNTNYSFGGPSFSAVAPPPYNLASVPTVAPSSGSILVDVISEPMTLLLSSDVDGLPGDRSAAARINVGSSTGGLIIVLGGGSSQVFILDLGSAFTAAVEESGDVGSFSDAAEVHFTHANMVIGGVTTIPISLDPLPYEIAYNAGGLVATLFEVSQVSGPGFEKTSINAVHLRFDDFPVQDLPGQRLSYTGDIIVGHLEARLGDSPEPPPPTIPEPGTPILMVMGLALAGITVAARRRHQGGHAAA